MKKPRRPSALPWVGAGLAAAGVLLVVFLATAEAMPILDDDPLGAPDRFVDDEEGGDAASPPPPPSAPPDEEVVAGARMLDAEDGRRAVRVLILWTTQQVARRRKTTLQRLLQGKSGVFGPQALRRDTLAALKRGEGPIRGDTSPIVDVRYAATLPSTRVPSPGALEIARGVLTGDLLPSAGIRQRGPGAWVEYLPRGEGVQRVDARRIVRLQTWHADDGAVRRGKEKAGSRRYGGLWARLSTDAGPTNWYLYHAKAAPIAAADNSEAAALAVLAGLPLVPALDGRGVA